MGDRDTTDKLKLLVVDDHFFVHQIVAQILGPLVANILFAFSGKEALGILRSDIVQGGSPELSKLIRESRPDLADDLHFLGQSVDCIISDVAMTPMNGLELLKSVRVGEAGVDRALPFILLTGESNPAAIQAAISLDVSAFVLKPVSRDHLQSRLKRVGEARIALKQPDEYRKVELPAVQVLSPGPRSSPTPVTSKRSRPRQAPIRLGQRPGQATKSVEIDALVVGATIARDVVLPDGTLLFREGDTVTKNSLANVQLLHSQRRGIEGSILIYEE